MTHSFPTVNSHSLSSLSKVSDLRRRGGLSWKCQQVQEDVLSVEQLLYLELLTMSITVISTLLPVHISHGYSHLFSVLRVCHYEGP